jgi:hypothetical protein
MKGEYKISVKRQNKEIAMKKTIQAVAWSAIGIILLTMSISSTASSEYDLSWYTIDGGGGRSSGGPYELVGTIGQPDAAYSAGGGYELLGGFWPGGPLCFVDFEHFARFAEHWLDKPCNEGNDFCDGADLNMLEGVNGVDLRLFVEEWLCYCPTDWPLK